MGSERVNGARGVNGVRVKCQSNLLWHFTLTPFTPPLALYSDPIFMTPFLRQR